MPDKSISHQEILQAPKRTFETVFEHANDAIFVVDLENDSIVDCNPAAEELVEYSREELLSMPASDLHPHNLPQFMDFAESVLERGHSWTDEITCYCKSGDILPAEMSASVVELEGRPHVVNLVRQRTDEEERDWFEALIEHGNDLITVVKPDGTIRYQSETSDTVLGYASDDLRDERYVDFVHPEDEEDVRASLAQMADSSTGVVRRLEYRFRRRDGSWAWLEGAVSYRPKKPITGFVINARDITPEKESQQQAAVLNRTMRHNLRNELSVIIGHAERLSNVDNPEVASTATTMLSKAWNLHDATTYTKDLNDILQSSRVTQKRFDLTALLENTIVDLTDSYPEATFDVDLPDDQLVVAAPKLRVAIDHVLRNAVEHNDADTPRIEVTVRPPSAESSEVYLTVVDNGPGIPAQQREVLLEGEETPLKHGNGIGLWLVNWIITRSGGRITFDENDPRGSRVTLALSPANGIEQ
ncbi:MULTISPECIES: PAS domain-containing sensor histidine kinase [Salinibaculum]|uniref:PAS domain-containing sensor histidine kinase n=1 Tax=Salinibaculum TaxID=2732368 RepID=UPI0030CE97D0